MTIMKEVGFPKRAAGLTFATDNGKWVVGLSL